MTSTTLAFEAISRRVPQALTSVSRRPDVSRESAYFLSKIGDVKSAAALVNDPRLFNFAMRAFGLSDMSYAKAMIRKVLEQGIDQPTSLANRLVDQRFKDLAQTFNFERYGETATTFSRARQGTVDRYIRLVFEEEAGRDNEGVRLALNFERKAGQLTSAYGLLADKALMTVAATALQLPNGFNSFDVDKQAKILASRVNVRDFATAEIREKFLRRFTALWDISNPIGSSAAFANLSGSSAIGIGNRGDIGVNLLQAIQAIKRGPR